MVGAAFASVPLYRLFCQVTGFGGTPMVDTSAVAPGARGAAARIMTVRFDGNVRADVPWRFRPVATTADVRVGERKMAFYRATNTGDTAITGSATFNVSPDTVAQYFVKTQCFCFNEQTLKAGQSVDMPVVYHIDPAILDDPEAAKVEEVTLSYTFFRVDNPADPGQGTRANTATLRGR